MKIAAKFTIAVIAAIEVPDGTSEEQCAVIASEQGNKMLATLNALDPKPETVVPVDAVVMTWDVYEQVKAMADGLRTALLAAAQEETPNLADMPTPNIMH